MIRAMAADSFENERLMQLWREGRRRAVIAFLQRAITPESTLQDVFDALNFPEVREHLASARLQDVIVAPRPAAPAERPKVRLRSVPERKTSPEATQQMRDKLLALLQATPDGVTTPELWSSLRDAGFETATVVVAQLLKGLETTGQVRDCGGRPIVWKVR
jgi:hypothetical protein